MTVQSLWPPFISRNRFAGAIGFCFVLVLNLSPGDTLAQDSVAVTGAAPVAGFASGASAMTDEALREQVGRDGWLQVRVDLRQSGSSAPPLTAAQTAIQQGDLDQAAQDLLFALPPGSYDSVLRVAGSSSLTVRVDSAGLDGLVASPLAAAVAAVRSADMQRIAANGDFSGNWSHSLLAIKIDGSLWGMGSNYWGQLGLGSILSTLKDYLLPVKILSDVKAVAAGDSHSLALKTDGSLWAWGHVGSGQIGDSTAGTDRRSPVLVLTSVATVVAGSEHSLAIKTDGSLWVWGDNGSGQIGDSTTTNRWTPVPILTGVAAAAAGYAHTLAIKTDGSLWAWGSNVKGQLGEGPDIDPLTPARVLTGVAAVAAGVYHSLALNSTLLP